MSTILGVLKKIKFTNQTRWRKGQLTKLVNEFNEANKDNENGIELALIDRGNKEFDFEVRGK